jgi:hypothetical protein
MSKGTKFEFNGDLPMEMPIAFGVQNAEHETKDWANARFLMVVGANPLEMRLPDAHLLFEAPRTARAWSWSTPCSPPPRRRPTPGSGSAREPMRRSRSRSPT